MKWISGVNCTKVASWEQQNPACSFLPVLQRDCARARASVYIGITSSALRRSLTPDWDLLMGRIWSGPSEPATLHFCRFSGAFTHLSLNRAPLPRAADLNSHTHMCVPLASECRCYLFRFWGSHWCLFSSLLQWTHHLKQKNKNCETVAGRGLLLANLAGPVRSGPAALCAASGDNLFVGGVFWVGLITRSAHVLVVSKHRANGGFW